MRMEDWSFFVQSRDIQVDSLFHQDWWITRWFLTHGKTSSITWVERDQYSIAVAGLVAGGKERKEGRQTIFFTPPDPFNSDANEAELITDFNKARKVHYQIHWSPEQVAAHWAHLRSAQNAGLDFWQTGSNAIITYQSVPKECVVKVVSESGKREMFAGQLTPREGPKVTLREKWVHRSSNALRLPRETEKKLQTGDSNPIPSESHLAEGGVLNSFDLRVDGIPNEETYKDEQYVQRIAEQVQKLVNTNKKYFKRRPTWWQHSEWKGREENLWSRNLRIAWKSEKDWQSTVSTMFFIRGSWIPSMSSRKKTKYVRGNAFLHTTKKSSHTSKTPTWHSRRRVEQSMVLIRGNSIISKPKNLSEKSRQKTQIRRFLTASRRMRNCTQTSQNITTGQKKGPKIF